MLKPEQAAATRDRIAQAISIANSAFDAYVSSGYLDEANEQSAVWHLDAAFAMLAVWAEALGLPTLLGEIQSDRKQAQAEGMNTETLDPFGEPDQKWAIPARRHLVAIESVFVSTSSHVITRDIESILRAGVYSITNTKVFGAPPRSESEVHLRLENILRPLFADLLHKPRLPKAIKNFEPDTGLPSIRTLLEYKFLARADMVPVVADEILADTLGYTSHDWSSFVYVIYEVRRFRPEAEWRQLLRDVGAEARTSVVVLSGEPSESDPGAV